MSNPEYPSRRPLAHRWVRSGLVFLGIFLLFAGLVGYQILITRSVAKKAAVTDATNLALVLESQIDSELDSAARTVQLIVDTLDLQVMDPAQLDRYESEVNALLRAHAAAHPIANALRIFDTDGNRLYTSASIEPEKLINIEDRNFFQQLREDPTAGILFSRVGLGRLTGSPMMWVAKAIRDPVGRFLGVVVVAVDLAAIHAHFGKLNLGDQGVVVLRRLDDGAVVVRWPGPIEVDNRPEPDIPTRQAVLRQGSVGVIEIISPVDGSHRIYGYRKVGRSPFLVAVGLASEDYLSEWRQDSLRLLMMSLIFVTILAIVFVQLLLSMRRRDRTELALRRSEVRFRRLIHDNNSVILQIDPTTGAILDANAAACRFYGWSQADFHAKCFQDFCQAPAAAVRTDLRMAVEGHQAYLVYPQRLANDDSRVVEVYCTPIQMNDGLVLVSIVHDISERRRLEQELRQQNLLLNTVLGNLDAHVFMKDREGRFLYVNQAVADFLGHSVSALVGARQVDLLPPEEADSIRELDEAVFISGRPYSGEERLLDRSGEPHHFWTVKVPLMEAGQPERLIGLATDITELHRLREELERRATTDDLTGVASRGHFYTTADNILVRAQRYGEALSLLILDIDHFKDVNDTYGHQAGDRVLRGLAEYCRQAIRACDLIGRMGGEEFAILLPTTGSAVACQLAERLCRGVREQRWGREQSTDRFDDLAVTVSIGVAALHPAIASLDALYAQADRALYTAKAAGRDRVSCD
ncbi:MAG: diguanylate cyclase [Sphingobacteriia bacterium]|nr:diguanylate cyclase [Sphingobacteriia bacterium]